MEAVINLEVRINTDWLTGKSVPEIHKELSDLGDWIRNLLYDEEPEAIDDVTYDVNIGDD